MKNSHLFFFLLVMFTAIKTPTVSAATEPQEKSPSLPSIATQVEGLTKKDAALKSDNSKLARQLKNSNREKDALIKELKKTRQKM